MEYIDLGLPSGTKWAMCNVGGSEEYEKNAEEWAGRLFYGDSKEDLIPLSLPTHEQWVELFENTTQERTNLAKKNKGRNKYPHLLLVSKINSNYIVFPLLGPRVYIDASGRGFCLDKVKSAGPYKPYGVSDEFLKQVEFRVREVKNG